MTLKFKIFKISNLNIIEQHFKLRVGKGTEKITLIDLTCSLFITRGDFFQIFRDDSQTTFQWEGMFPQFSIEGTSPKSPP